MNSKNVSKHLMRMIKQFPKSEKDGEQVYTMQRSVDLGNVSSATTEVDGAFVFALTDLQGYSEFTSLFDQYILSEVEMLWLPHENDSQVASGNASTTKLLVAADYDDGTPINENAIVQYSPLKIINFNQELRIKIKPHVALAAYNGSFSGYANVADQWIDIASSGVQHYGIKYVLTAANASSLSGWRVFAKYTLKLKMLR